MAMTGGDGKAGILMYATRHGSLEQCPLVPFLGTLPTISQLFGASLHFLSSKGVEKFLAVQVALVGNPRLRNASAAGFDTLYYNDFVVFCGIAGI